MRVLSTLFYRKWRPRSRVWGPSPPVGKVRCNSGLMLIPTVRVPQMGDIGEVSSPSAPSM